MRLVQLVSFGIPISDASSKAGDEVSVKVGLPRGFTAAHEFGDRKLAMGDLAEAPVVALERLWQRLGRFIVEGNQHWILKRRLKGPENEGLVFNFGVPVADVYESEVRAHSMRSDIIEESIGVHFYIWSRFQAKLSERNFALIRDRLPLPNRTTEKRDSEDRHQDRRDNGRTLPDCGPRKTAGVIRAIVEITVVVIGYAIAGISGWFWCGLFVAKRYWSAWTIFGLGFCCALVSLIWAVCDAVSHGA